jgi:RHS repeat-associated protein
MADGGVSQIDYVVTNRTVTQAMVTDGRGNKTAHRFNTRSHEVAVVDALGQQTRMTRDFTTNQVMEVRDPLNRVTKFTYDAVGNLETVTDPLGNRSQRLYDAASRLTALIDPRGKTTQFTYDAVNQVTQIADALNGLTGFTYDPNGNLLTVADAKHQTTTYVYDNMDRLLTRTDALARNESYQYDLVGNLTRFTDRKNQQTNFVYDPLNHRTSTTYADSTSTTVAYDAVGNVTKLTDSLTGAIERSYDVLDRVTQEVSPQGIVSYSYDVLSRRLSMRANALQPVTYSYDANSQLTQVAQGVINGVLTHDALGRRTQLQRSNGVTTTYAYDPASRLAGLTHAKGATVLESLNYGLDQADNKTQVQQAQQHATALPPAVTAAYDAANQQAQFAGANLAYDANGNLTSDGTNTYVWDARDRLIGISGGTTATFSYDALDRRLAKTINGATTMYLYDGADVVTEAGATNASYLSTLNIDEPLVRQTPNGNEYYHTDDLGSTVALSDDSGSVTTRYTYGPFGETSTTGTPSGNPFQFTGRENDGSGLYYYRARYYSPSRSRFLTEDPLGFGAGDMNLYGYVFNNPTNLTDPSGEIAPIIAAAGIACLRGAAQSAGQDLLIGLAQRKVDGGGINIDWMEAAKGCLTGGFNAGKNAFKFARGAGKSGNSHNSLGQGGGQSGNSGAPTSNVRNSKEKEALVDMAKSDKRKGISQADMDAYKELNKGLPDPFPPDQVRGDPGHNAGAPHSRVPYGHVGPVNHIPIK